MKRRTRSGRDGTLVNPREFYTVSQISALLHFDEEVIYRSAKSGHLPVHLLGGVVRLRGLDVQAFAMKRLTSTRKRPIKNKP